MAESLRPNNDAETTSTDVVDGSWGLQRDMVTDPCFTSKLFAETQQKDPVLSRDINGLAMAYVDTKYPLEEPLNKLVIKSAFLAGTMTERERNRREEEAQQLEQALISGEIKPADKSNDEKDISGSEPDRWRNIFRDTRAAAMLSFLLLGR